MKSNFLAILLVLSLMGCSKHSETTHELPPPEVSTVRVQPESIVLTRDLVGRVDLVSEAEVRPQVSGIIREVLFEEGSAVTEGQQLYVLDDAMFEAEHQRNLATLNRAQVSAKLAYKTYERASALVEATAISQQAFDDAEAAFLSAEAEVQVAEAAAAASEVNLGYTRIESPIAGIIGKSDVTRGALVMAGQGTALAVVRQLDPVYVNLRMASREWTTLQARIREGTLEQAIRHPVKLTLEDGRSLRQPGEVLYSETTVDPVTGSSLLRVRVENPDHILLPGMFLQARVNLAVKENAILVPQKAVQRSEAGSTSVLILNDDGKVESREVTLEGSHDNDWIVGSGLEAGTRVIVGGMQWVRPGAPAVESPSNSNPQ